MKSILTVSLIASCVFCACSQLPGERELHRTNADKRDAPDFMIASFYGENDGTNGRKTASGEIFDPTKLTAAHRSIPFGTQLRVTNTENDRSVIVKVNDRGPFRYGRDLDLSLKAAQALEMVDTGTARVKVEVVH